MEYQAKSLILGTEFQNFHQKFSREVFRRESLERGKNIGLNDVRQREKKTINYKLGVIYKLTIDNVQDANKVDSAVKAQRFRETILT